MTHIAQTYDLSTLDGITGYMEGILLSDIRAAYDRKGILQPFGVALGTVTNGTKLPRPHPMMVGGKTIRAAQRQVLRMARNSRATGAIIAHMIDSPPGIVVQLEHKEFGDLVWTARIIRKVLQPFVSSTLATVAHFELEQTRFMPSRYMQ